MPTKSKYWERRNEEIFRWVDEQDIDVLKELIQFYEEAKSNVQKDIYAFFGQYAEDNEITRQEAMKLLRGEDLKTYRANAEYYRKEANKLPREVREALLHRLNKQYVASKARRLDALKQDITFELGKLNGEMNDLVRAHLENITTYTYAQAMDHAKSGSTLNRAAIEQIIQMPWNGYNYSEDLWGNTDNLARKLQKVFEKGFVRGSSVQEMAQEIRKTFNVQRSNAETVIRTDGNHIINNSTLKRYQNAGLKHVRIHVHLDDRTTEICKAHHRENKLYTLKEAEGVLPAHYNCRSTFVPDEDELLEEHWLKNKGAIK